MTAQVLRRVLQAALALVLLSILVFFMVRATGDPAAFLTDSEATAEDQARVRDQLGLDRPLIVQYAEYMHQVLTGNLGTSSTYHVPVTELISQRAGATVALALVAFALSLLVALPLGLYSAYWRGGRFDSVVRLFAAVGQATPSFWVGILLILAFAVHLRVLPSGGYGAPSNFVLPAVTLTIEPVARLSRLLRSSSIEELGREYVTLHRIKGLPERVILWRHVLRNAGLTSLTFVGIMLVGFLKGSVLVETVFVWPGVGRLLVESIGGRDFAVIQGVALLVGAAFIVTSFAVDLLYLVLDPRLRARR